MNCSNPPIGAKEREIAAQVSDEMWTQAINSHLQISLDQGADHLNEINYPEGARPTQDYRSDPQE